MADQRFKIEGLITQGDTCGGGGLRMKINYANLHIILKDHNRISNFLK